ncbi:MAG: LTA synthase family protein [Helicobacteraceae bacterium]|jgi:hypothetical protein|nr:LTA synthase family protein [Helicobacteraceae bacterium]
MERFNLFFRNIQQELKVFFFLLLLLSVFRAAFIYIYSSQLEDNSGADIFWAMWYGFRLSMKTAGFVIIPCFVFITLPTLFFPNYRSETIRRRWYGFAVVFFTCCFFIRIPYYEIFGSAFNLMLINGMRDDILAIVQTAVKEYGAVYRTAGAVFVSIVLIKVLFIILRIKTLSINIRSTMALTVYSVGLTCFVMFFAYFVRYAGVLSYVHTITWANAARFNSNLLNEAVLDDGQALYRVRHMYNRQRSNIRLTISAVEFREAIGLLGGNSGAGTIESAFEKTVSVGSNGEPPQTVVLILGETYALWPFLSDFRELGLVENGRRLQNSPNGFALNLMLSVGDGTIAAVNGLLSGLFEAGIYQNYEIESYKSVYLFGIGAVMRSLGYKTIFWYGGFEGWQDIKKYALAQSFDKFYGAGELNEKSGNAWGMDDKLLFNYVQNYIDSSNNNKTFHFILTTSNHGPYSIDVKKEGFDPDAIKDRLQPNIANDERTLNQLGHIWYSDMTIGSFVDSVYAKNPQSLFIITGDHANRFHFSKQQDPLVTMSVPCIFYGYGIEHSTIWKNRVGTHLQIAPTLAEMLGRKGADTYRSIFPSLQEADSSVAFNGEAWSDGESVKLRKEIVPNVQKHLRAAEIISIWRVKKGNVIDTTE